VDDVDVDSLFATDEVAAGEGDTEEEATEGAS
jgi:hypothetical protein